ncbi:hypothetical protein [Streptomyces sp. NPDC051000]|uniref:hypothetical protein n=1 Tax=unclassified Streptomyces TaxID=2593676 RepID=UPI003403B6AA
MSTSVPTSVPMPVRCPLDSAVSAGSPAPDVLGAPPRARTASAVPVPGVDAGAGPVVRRRRA